MACRVLDRADDERDMPPIQVLPGRFTVGTARFDLENEQVARGEFPEWDFVGRSRQVGRGEDIAVEPKALDACDSVELEQQDLACGIQSGTAEPPRQAQSPWNIRSQPNGKRHSLRDRSGGAYPQALPPAPKPDPMLIHRESPEPAAAITMGRRQTAKTANRRRNFKIHAGSGIV